jgi:ER lumen protein retaining receptor
MYVTLIQNAKSAYIMSNNIVMYLSNGSQIGVSLKSQLLNLLGQTMSWIALITRLKHSFDFSVTGISMMLVDFVACSIILNMMLYVDSIKATYNATLDNFPLWPYAIPLNLFLSMMFWYGDNAHAASFSSYVRMNNALMVSISQLQMERNIRQQQHLDQHQGITNATPTIGAIRVAILFTFLSKLFVFARSAKFLWMYSVMVGLFHKVQIVLDVVVYSDFLYHTGRYVKTQHHPLSMTTILTIRSLIVKINPLST